MELPPALVVVHLAEQHHRHLLEQAGRHRLIQLARGDRPAQTGRRRSAWWR